METQYSQVSRVTISTTIKRTISCFDFNCILTEDTTSEVSPFIEDKEIKKRAIQRKILKKYVC